MREILEFILYSFIPAANLLLVCFVCYPWLGDSLSQWAFGDSPNSYYITFTQRLTAIILGGLWMCFLWWIIFCPGSILPYFHLSSTQSNPHTRKIIKQAQPIPVVAVPFAVAPQ